MEFISIFKFFIFLLLVGFSIVVSYSLYQRRLRRLRLEWESARRYVTLKILVPRENEKAPVAAEQMFASLHGIYREGSNFQDQLSFELVAKEKSIQFYARIPEHLKDFVEGQIYAQYPDVEIDEVTDYTQLDFKDLEVSGCELTLNKNDVYPIKSFANFDVDPLSGITSVLGKTKKDEQIWVQIIVRPASDTWQNKGIAHISSVRTGQSKGLGVFNSFFKTGFRIFFDLLGTAAGRVEEASSGGEAPEIKLSGPEEAGLKEAETKITKLGFETKIRVLAMAPDAYTTRSKVESVGGVFKQFNTLHANGFRLSQFSDDRILIHLYQIRDFSDKGYILNIEEVASIFHLPTATVETPHIVWAGSKKGEPPTNLPIEDITPANELTIFAKTDFRDVTHRFGMKINDRRLHMYAIGKTGTGKSTMLENMIIDDIREGRGVAVVDPHGELINHILDFIPSDRINDVVYFNPADRDFPLGFNPLENVDPDLKNIIASGVVGIFKKIFGESWGPRLEYILRNCILALLDYPDSTLLGIMKILTDKDYRKKVVAQLKDPVIRDFFTNEFEKYDPKFRTEAIAPIQNKVGQFLSSSTIRNIVGQPKSSFNIREVMDQGKILLMDLSIGKIGEDNSALLGAMMITKVQLAAMQRANIPEAQRHDFYLYVDEFQNFATDSFAIILSEARKYHLNIVMTNQYIAQMPEVVAKAIFGNVGTVVSFRVGAQDATALVKEFEPIFDANDLINLDNYSIYVKMAIDGVTRPAFSALTLPPNSDLNNNREKVIEVSRERYSKPRGFVEEKINEWSLQSSQKKEVKNIDNSEPVPNPVTIITKKNLASDTTVNKNTEDDKYKIVRDKRGKKWYIEKSSEIKNKESLITIDEFKSLDENTEKQEDNNTQMQQLKAGETVKIDST